MRLALLISGGGTTMEAIVQACQNGVLKGKVTPALVIANRESAGGIKKARRLGIKDEDILVIKPKDFQTGDAFGEKIIAECQKRSVDLIGQYGWLVMTPGNVIDAYRDRIVNQHPGPLDPRGNGDFGGAGMYGLRVHAARLCFVKKRQRDFWTEATAHRVTEEFDEGAILKRRQVPVLESDTAETLQARVLPVEYEVQIELLKNFADGSVSEFHRESPLVLPGEEKILLECKEQAIKLYPHG